ncbi:MAG: hypothetical protein D6696_01475 [Acidobacteria bacterium]|nr:MAG: hypothetical protein D6696_01475 [Acidobacteriota bacterium]
MRVFVAATRELKAERALVARVAERINHKYGAEPGVPWHLELVDWGEHARPLLAPPAESAAGNGVPEITEEDVFLGLAWLRFDPDEEEPSGGGEEAFALARELWRDAARPSCFFLRSTRLPDSLQRIDGHALGQVQAFFSSLPATGNGAVECRELESDEQLQGALMQILDRVVTRRREEATAEAPAAARGTATRLADLLEPGRAYEVTLLAVAVAGYPQLAREHPAESLTRVEASFRNLAAGTAATYGGEILRWRDGGGVLIFGRQRSGDHAVMTGLKILHTLPILNLDPSQNPLPVSIAVRAAAHDAIIVYEPPLSELASADLSFVVELQRSFTEAGEMCVSKRLFERLDQRLRPHFSFKGRLGPEPIQACRLATNGAAAPQESLAASCAQVEQQIAELRARLRSPSAAGDEPLSTALDRAYTALGRFCADFGTLDNKWSAAFLTALANAATTLVKAELGLWQALRARLDGGGGRGPDPELAAVAHAISRRRSRPVIILGKLAQRCRLLARSGPGAEAAATEEETSSDLLRKLDALLKADALDLETELTDLLLHHKREVMDFVLEQREERRYRPLLDRLWEAADLVLLDDLFAIRDHRRAHDEKVFEALIDSRVDDGRFRTVWSLLARVDRPDPRQVMAAFARAGHQATEQDLQIVWRCLVLGHRDPGMRAHAASHLTLYAAWQSMSHPSIPLESIQALGDRFTKREDEDAHKIFFDCVRDRLKTAAQSFRTGEEMETLTRVILQLLDFTFLVESGYFERFDDLLATFLERAQTMGLSVAYFESLRQKLEEARRSGGKEGKLPKGIQKLPLTIQRRLASDPRYVSWFVTHPDPRIAGETVRHIGLSNVERLLRYPEINATVMASILRRPELFTRKQPLIVALNHPKCTHAFASRYLAGMARSRGGRHELQRLARNPSANPAVRSAAQQLLRSVKV